MLIMRNGKVDGKILSDISLMPQLLPLSRGKRSHCAVNLEELLAHTAGEGLA